MAINVVGKNEEHSIDEVDVSVEMRDSFLEYAYSVIYARALPDARDGLKPVQRRIIYQMQQMGLSPSHGHVKSQRVVGEVMGKLHPHGDAPIYDALVRLAQDFNLRLPLVDGHGNFGSLDDGPAAARYTEARLAPSAALLTSGLDEDAVDFVPNYDNQFQQPEVLPADFPSLLVNGASGIAVGMATSIPPHNPAETLRAALYLLKNPQATTEDLMRFVPGPDFPGGGIIPGLAAVKESYETGRGIFKVRAKATMERVSARKMGIVVTELPYMVGPERVIERIKDSVNSGKIKGISAVTNLTDREHGLRLVINVKNGFNPESVLALLYKYTPLEESFATNAVALVDGQPKTMTLADMLQVFIAHRIDVTLRRTHFLISRKEERLHLVQGLLRAILDIDDVIAIIRSSGDAEEARERLQLAFDLSEVQARYILELRLRRLTKFSRIELENERDELESDLDKLRAIASSRALLEQKVADDLQETAAAVTSPRRTVLLSDDAVPVGASSSGGDLEIADEPCIVVLTPSGGIARIPGAQPPANPEGDASDSWRSWGTTTTRGQVLVLTSDGNAHRIPVEVLPALVRSDLGQSLAGTVALADIVSGSLGRDVEAIAVVSDDASKVLALGTRKGIVKRVKPDWPSNRDTWPVVKLDEDDRVVGASNSQATDFGVFLTRSAQLLKFPIDTVRPQGAPAAGMAGIKLASNDEAIFFAAVEETPTAVVATVTEPRDGLPGTVPGSAKLTPLAEYPAKGRATMGVRCHRFLKDEGHLRLAWAGEFRPVATSAAGTPVALPSEFGKRDASGVAVTSVIEALG
jgi:DNA gyrase subunit A